MKILARCFIMLLVISCASNLYAQEWIAYNHYVQPQTPVQTVYIQPQPIVVYQWTPYTIQQNFVIEQQRLFCRSQTIITRPVTQWIIQPVVIYR